MGAGTVPLLAAGASAQPCPALSAGHTGRGFAGMDERVLGPRSCLWRGAGPGSVPGTGSAGAGAAALGPGGSAGEPKPGQSFPSVASDLLLLRG